MNYLENKKLITPVVFMVFNRPAKTRRVFEEIRKAKPERLFIIADGPRNDEETLRCREVRDIAEKIDWPCQVFKNYARYNLGCKVRISSGITWVFENVEEAIFLEDDCLPDPSFFPFCAELLEKYRHEEKVMQICGYNFLARNKKFKYQNSYYFSNIGIMLGWASWRRAWKHYDVNISNWPEIKKSGLLKKALKNNAVIDHYNHLFDNYYAKKVDSWDSQWFLARWLNNGLSAVSKNNLIQNIGFDAEAAHKAVGPKDPRAHVPVRAVKFPLIHPDGITANPKFDAYIFRYQLKINYYLGQRIRWFFKSSMPHMYQLLKNLKGKFDKKAPK